MNSLKLTKLLLFCSTCHGKIAAASCQFGLSHQIETVEDEYVLKVNEINCDIVFPVFCIVHLLDKNIAEIMRCKCFHYDS